MVLIPPVNWRKNPNGNRSWRYQLNTLTWLKPLLLDHALEGNLEALVSARNFVLDWATAHLKLPNFNDLAWYDMAVGLRAPYIAYVLRACLVEEMLEEEDALLLVEAAQRHGTELVEDRNYASDHNHGLFQDEGLYLLAHQLPHLPAAAKWRELALKRMVVTLRATIDFEEGAHLEHSSSYQLAIVSLLTRLTENVTEMSELGELLERVTRTAAWHVTPTDRVAQLGDTDDVVADKWALRAASRVHGLNPLFRAGHTFVREGNSYMAVSAAHHSSVHKHSDDTSLLLVEGGQLLLGDAGRWSYDERDPDRRYARSAHAHNVLTVDDQDFDWRESEPYGSGLIAAGEGYGWYAILVTNPMFEKWRVEYRRVLLYRPTETLIVIDDIRSEAVHDYARRFHFGPGLEAKATGENRIVIAGEEITAALTDFGEATQIELDRGRDEPERLGWTYPGDRERVPVWTATMRTRATNATFTAMLTLGEEVRKLVQPRLEADRVVVEVGAGSMVEVQFKRDKQEAEVCVS